jgi:hypothetical protein
MSLFEASLIPALGGSGKILSQASWSFYASGTSTPLTVYGDAALTVPLGPKVVANAAGRFAPIYFDDSKLTRAILRDASGSVLTRSDIDPINDASSGAYDVSVTDAPFKADNTGGQDSYPAFMAAIAASSVIRVPAGTYRLETEPTWTKSLYWAIDPEAVFTGAGTGFQKFPYMATNGAQMAVGPFIQSRSSQKSVHPNGGIAAFNVEMIQPTDYGAAQSVALYAGSISANPNPAGNNWAINCLVNAQPTAKGVFQAIEADADNESPDAIVKGISITGGGSYDAEVGLEVARLPGSYWKTGVFVVGANDAMVIKGKSGSRGVVVQSPTDSVVPEGGIAFSARQFENGNGMAIFQRATDTNPSGYAWRLVDAANTRNIVLMDILGNFATEGVIRANNFKAYGPTPVVAPGEIGFGATIVTTASSGGASGLPGTPAGYLVINIGGNNLKVPFYND